MAAWFWQNSKLVIVAQIAARQQGQLSPFFNQDSVGNFLTRSGWSARAMKIGILGNGSDTTEKERK